MKTGVAVEKLAFVPNSRNLGDRKCLGDPRKSLVGLPNAISFLRFSWEGVFQHPRLLTSVNQTGTGVYSEICEFHGQFSSFS
jgi:hypothetical protein